MPDELSEEDFRITTESFVLFFIPLIPFKTFVYCDLETKWYQDDEYAPIYYPAGEDNVYWPHVKGGWSFYLAPVLTVLWLLFFFVFPAIAGVMGDIRTNYGVNSDDILITDSHLDSNDHNVETLVKSESGGDPEPSSVSSEQSSYDNKRTYSASEIYENSKDSLFIVETECDLKISYPDFKVEYSYDSALSKLYIELVAQNSNSVISDSVVYAGSGFLLDNRLYTNNHVINCGTLELEDTLKWAYLNLIDYYNQGYVLDRSYLVGIDFNYDSLNDKIFDYVYSRDEYYYLERDQIESYLIAVIAEYLSEHIKVTGTGRKIYAYHESDNFKSARKLYINDVGGTFPEKDYASLTLETDMDFLDFNDDYKVTIGEEIYVLGFPEITVDSPDSDSLVNYEVKKELPIITKGIISSLKESNTGVDYYVLDAAAFYGSSGGPVINKYGDVIGILTARVESLTFMLPLSEIS